MNAVHDKDLTFRFKGQRDYIQGPDILDETLTWLVQAGFTPAAIDLAFHRMARRQLTARWGAAPVGVEPCAICSFTDRGTRHVLHLVERDEAVSERVPYPEEDILQRVEYDLPGRRATLRGRQPFSDAEVFVSMIKGLHQNVFASIKGKWIFVRASLPAYVRRSEPEERSVTITANFNGKLTRSAAVIDGEKVGDIFFSII